VERFANECVCVVIAKQGASPVPKDRYQRQAMECLRLADQAVDPDNRRALIHMAQAWLRLADQAERNGVFNFVTEMVGQERLESGSPRNLPCRMPSTVQTQIEPMP